MQRGQHCRSGPYFLRLLTAISGQLELMLIDLASLFLFISS